MDTVILPTSNLQITDSDGRIEYVSDESLPNISAILVTFSHPIISWTNVVTLKTHEKEYGSSCGLYCDGCT
jgi:hypothetical protein